MVVNPEVSLTCETEEAQTSDVKLRYEDCCPIKLSETSSARTIEEDLKISVSKFLVD